MKKLSDCKTVRLLIFPLIAVAIWLGSVDRAHAGDSFSNKNLRGVYVFRSQGWNRGSNGSAALGDSLGPYNVIGSFTADGDGNLSGNETVNIIYNSNGTPTMPSACQDESATPSVAICANNMSGTYSINADGTGTWAITKTPVAGSDCRCGSATTTFAIILQGGPHQVSDVVLFSTQSSEVTASGEADRRSARLSRSR